MANCQNQNQCQREMYFIKEEKPSCCSVTKIPCGQTSQNVVTVLPSCGRNTTCCSVPPVGPPPPMIKTEPCGKVSSSCCAIEKCCTPVYSCLSVVKDPKAAQPTKKCITTPCPPSYCTVNRCQPVCCPTKPYPCVKPKCPVENFCTNVDCENVGLTPYAKEYMSETGKLVKNCLCVRFNGLQDSCKHDDCCSRNGCWDSPFPNCPPARKWRNKEICKSQKGKKEC